MIFLDFVITISEINNLKLKVFQDNKNYTVLLGCFVQFYGLQVILSTINTMVNANVYDNKDEEQR